MHKRIKYLREEVLGIRQKEMATQLGLKQGSLSDIERKKTKKVTERVINDICREFSVNEKWLRNGEGEIFVQAETFSLDEFAKKSALTDLEIDLIKSYMSLDKSTRQQLIAHFKTIFNKHSEMAATTHIETEIENYRLELEAEKRDQILSASGKQERELG
ncbi:MAG TPA: helix-turn-helix transcriptional regulator [Bacillus bacterium]|nr:helix-turn-helix transcriptional regulator [Bacillus sp. (in: firmicutes)]